VAENKVVLFVKNKVLEEGSRELVISNELKPGSGIQFDKNGKKERVLAVGKAKIFRVESGIILLEEK